MASIEVDKDVFVYILKHCTTCPLYCSKARNDGYLPALANLGGPQLPLMTHVVPPTGDRRSITPSSTFETPSSTTSSGIDDARLTTASNSPILQPSATSTMDAGLSTRDLRPSTPFSTVVIPSSTASSSDDDPHPITASIAPVLQSSTTFMMDAVPDADDLQSSAPSSTVATPSSTTSSIDDDSSPRTASIAPILQSPTTSVMATELHAGVLRSSTPCATRQSRPIPPSDVRMGRRVKNRTTGRITSATTRVNESFSNIRPTEWRHQQVKLGLKTASDYEAVVNAFINDQTGVRRMEISGEMPTSLSTNEYLRTGFHLARRTINALANSKLQICFSHFLVLLFFSYCAALETMDLHGVDVDLIMEALTSFGLTKRRRLLACGKKINAIIVELVSAGWDLARATEVFFLYAISPSKLNDMAHDTFQHIQQHLSSQPFVNYSFQDCLCSRMSIPGLLGKMTCGGSQQFYDALGYKTSMWDTGHLGACTESVVVVTTDRDVPGFRHWPTIERTIFPLEAGAGTVSDSQHETLRHEEYSRDLRPSPDLMTQLRVLDTADSIRFAIDGDIDGLTQLFSKGLASPSEVSYTRGYSLVRWALYGGMHNHMMVKFLLSRGAPVDEESYKHTWDFIYRRKCSADELIELSCITLEPPNTYKKVDWLEEQRFPLSHQIVLGRSSKVLKDELHNNPRAVHEKDAMGRTALDWATARAELSHMGHLIAGGSSLNNIDNSGRSTVLHAVDSHNYQALLMLLEAGADPNPEVQNRSSPLIAASFGGLLGMIKLLIKYGANIAACNPEGRTALSAVTSLRDRTRAHDCAKILLDHGADPRHQATATASYR